MGVRLGTLFHISYNSTLFLFVVRYRIINKIYLYKSALLHTIFPRYLYLTTNKNKVELYEI